MYYNKEQGVSLHKHPLANNFRKIFYEVLEKRLQQDSDEDQQEAKKKPKKVVQQKTTSSRKMSMFGGVNSTIKRKDSNVALENPFPVQGESALRTSKLNEEGKSRERFRTLRKALAATQSERAARQKEALGAQNGLPGLDEYEATIYQAYQFYVARYSLNPGDARIVIEDLQSYRQCGPDEVVNAIVFLKLAQLDPSLFWIARAYLALPLPEGWSCIHVDNVRGRVWHNYLLGLTICQHPGWFYILHLVQISLENTPCRFSEGKQQKVMLFEDILGRSCDIDIGELVYNKLQQSRELDLRRLPYVTAELEAGYKNLLKKKMDKFSVDDKSDRPEIDELYNKQVRHAR